MKQNKFQIDIKKTGQKIKALCKERNVTVKDIQKELFRLSKMLNVSMEEMIEVVSEPIV